jgi:hypothetical protein
MANKLMTIGDMAVTYDCGWYYVRHATTDKLIRKTQSKGIAYKVATDNSNYKGDPRRTNDD